VTPAERARDVQLIIFDVDGVLTDGRIYIGEHGEVFKAFSTLDGHGLKLLAAFGITPVVITGRDSPAVLARLTGLPIALLTARNSKIVETRALELKLAKVFQGRREKGPALLELCEELKVAPANAAYMGDDVNDLPAMKPCGLTACPADAVAEVRSAVHFVASAPVCTNASYCPGQGMQTCVAQKPSWCCAPPAAGSRRWRTC
jgi:3-deoxy-D-manno-octulosonate 8-phosphate phosphatase (KDO 8-P phosphatase)